MVVYNYFRAAYCDYFYAFLMCGTWGQLRFLHGSVYQPVQVISLEESLEKLQ